MIKISQSVAQKIVSSIQQAVEIDILEDNRTAHFVTQNGTPARIWDYIYRNISEALTSEDGQVFVVHRGPWAMVVYYDQASESIITLMREKRFLELQKQRPERRKMHYLDLLTSCFNKELTADYDQASLFEKSFSDADRAQELIKSMLSMFESDISVIKHHALVLFEANDYQLQQVRIVMLTPSLEIAHDREEQWSKFITIEESFIVSQVDSTSIEISPAANLSLKNKALMRKEKQSAIKNNNLENQLG